MLFSDQRGLISHTIGAKRVPSKAVPMFPKSRSHAWDYHGSPVCIKCGEFCFSESGGFVDAEDFEDNGRMCRTCFKASIVPASKPLNVASAKHGDTDLMAAPVAGQRFKVGDRLKCIYPDFTTLKAGDVIEVLNSGNGAVFDANNGGWATSLDGKPCFELVASPPIDASKIERGDWVKVREFTNAEARSICNEYGPLKAKYINQWVRIDNGGVSWIDVYAINMPPVTFPKCAITSVSKSKPSEVPA